MWGVFFVFLGVLGCLLGWVFRVVFTERGDAIFRGWVFLVVGYFVIVRLFMWLKPAWDVYVFGLGE